MIQNFLESIGLSEKEAEIYQKLLTVQYASALELSRMTNINRTTVYPVIEQLKKKGLAIETKENGKVHYQAEQPERLETYIRNEKNKLEEQEKLLDEVIPRLKGVSLQGGEKPVVKIYDGREGILKSVEEYYQVGDTDKEAYLIYPRDKMKDFFTEKEQQKAKENRLKHNVKLNSIFTSEKEVYASDKSSNRHQIDPKKYPIACEIGLYADHVRIHTLSNSLSAIYIKSKDVADTLRVLFDLAIKGIDAESKEKK